jgi:hypothetical protein
MYIFFLAIFDLYGHLYSIKLFSSNFIIVSRKNTVFAVSLQLQYGN